MMKILKADENCLESPSMSLESDKQRVEREATAERKTKLKTKIIL